MMFLYYFTNYVKYLLFSKMIASGEKFGFVFIERWLSKNIAFLRLDSREIDFIQAVFFKAVFRDLGEILVVGGELFQNTPFFFKKMGLK
ncbi:hypothetical protein HpDR12_04980 [Helicobacter pylori]|uniref:hypothetical protein n=1 Tax=Helicobacter pylori TaxID=210 RepID=UPI00165B3009|nr:hypothetical protein [Helicobacter pylori]MCQ2811268.1 hypothetical protein [Helicobacter pylori]WQY09043.1 hypothetical protein KVM71_03815 [Helicobacter pylori]